jgi:predicted Zn-dependent protease
MSSMRSSNDRPRFLSEADCHALTKQLERIVRGGGYTAVQIASTWTGNIRWARNQVINSGEVCNNKIVVVRNLQGGVGRVILNDTTASALLVAARRAEQIALLHPTRPQSDLVARLSLESHTTPQLFDKATYQLDAKERAAAALTLADTAASKAMLSAGYIEVLARSLAILDTEDRVLYFPYTQAQYSVTVRDPKGTASGWAGVDWNAWHDIDAPRLTAVALEKCLRSQAPVRIEPGRYTTILEPQAVGDFVSKLFAIGEGGISFIDNLTPNSGDGPFNKDYIGPHHTHLGEQVVDERITISANPMDPTLGFPPFNLLPDNQVDPFTVEVYHPVTWIKNGVLTQLAYSRTAGLREFGRNTGMPNSGAFRMTGGETSIEEMITTTKRGIYVTRFDQLQLLDFTSQLYRGYTRDGLWLIENGKIAKAIKNFAFTESILFILNNIEQLGVPQRIFHPDVADPFLVPQPIVVPPLKVRDFSFTALTEAV